MRILFVLAGTTLLRHFDSTILALTSRGHHVRVATPQDEEQWALPHSLRNQPQVETTDGPGSRGDQWRDGVMLLRSFRDYLRYLEEPFLGADALRERAWTHLRRTLARDASGDGPEQASLVQELVTAGSGAGSGRLRTLLALIEESVPSDADHEAFLRAERPDIVLVTPLVFLGGAQADYVKSARALGIPVGFPVFSWDNLTTKGVIHVQPDRVFVWNDLQKKEAVNFHAVPEDRIVVTGAPRFDEFIAMTPGSTRDEFCAQHRLDPAQPILTYLCSSDFVAGDEAAFVRRWVEEVRQEAALRHCNIVIRPHPRAATGWDAFDAGGWPHVAVALSKRMKSKTVNVDQALFDAIHHGAAVIGLNTSAQIEAGILGKPVYTILAPGLERGQQGTLHFHYLLRDGGGFVEVAKDFDEHRRGLADAVSGRYDADRIRGFVQRFIRPAGWDRPATPLLADAIESLRPERRSRRTKWFPARAGAERVVSS